MDHLRRHLGLYLLVFLFLVNIFIWYVVLHDSRHELTVAFLDIGQGDSIFIEAPSGAQMLIDGGSSADVLRKLSAVMPFYDRSLDVVVATHPDADHVGGLPAVLERYRVSYFLESGNESDTNVYQALDRLLLEKGVPRLQVRRGMQVMLDPNVSFTVLFPDRDVTKLESNTASIVGQLVFGETEFMLTGDSPKAIEKYLVFKDGKALASDVLKAGHHGSKTSTSPEFVRAVGAQYAIISAGENNRYGHPHQESLETLLSAGSAILSTYENGTIEMVSDGKTIRVK